MWFVMFCNDLEWGLDLDDAVVVVGGIPCGPPAVGRLQPGPEVHFPGGDVVGGEPGGEMLEGAVPEVHESVARAEEEAAAEAPVRVMEGWLRGGR